MTAQNGFAITHALLFLVLASIIGFTGWYVYDTNQKSKNSLESASTGSFKKAEKTEKPGEQASQSQKPTDAAPGDWVLYENKELDFSFAYPRAWGSVKEAPFFSESQADVFTFSAMTDASFGGLEADYTSEGRGGLLTDYGGFIEESGKLYFKRYKDKSKGEEAAGYKYNDKKNCIYSTEAAYFTNKAYHATCNLSNSETFGLNFAVYDTTKLSTNDFTKLVNTVTIK